MTSPGCRWTSRSTGSWNMASRSKTKLGPPAFWPRSATTASPDICIRSAHPRNARTRGSGPASAFAYEDSSCFVAAFTAARTDIRHPAPSKLVQWLRLVSDRQAGSDEQFVEHFRDTYDDRMPVWALTEILELGHLSVLRSEERRVGTESIDGQW